MKILRSKNFNKTKENNVQRNWRYNRFFIMIPLMNVRPMWGSGTKAPHSTRSHCIRWPLTQTDPPLEFPGIDYVVLNQRIGFSHQFSCTKYSN